eukprot:jgi/Tetstr1/438060/TSEL_026686.t1
MSALLSILNLTPNAAFTDCSIKALSSSATIMNSETVRVSLDSQAGVQSQMTGAVDFDSCSSGESSPTGADTAAFNNRSSVDELRCYGAANISAGATLTEPAEFELCFGVAANSLPVKRTGSCTNLQCWGQ